MTVKRLRRLRMGLETVLGLRRQGFFTPYRYAAGVPEAGPYPEIEAAFAAADGIAGTLRLVEAGLGRIAGVDGPPPRPRWRQSWFPRLDAAAAWALVVASRPRRIVEVGSGHSTRFLALGAQDAAADAAQEAEAERPAHASGSAGAGAAGGGARITCIDPAPRASLAGLDIDWRREVLGARHLPLFAELRAGDVAFFDSSHLLWPGTDVDLMLNRILPALAPGVLVHVHDVFLPDPYPADWAWRGYTEQLGLAGYLTSPAWQVVWASHYAVTRLGAGARPAVAALPMPEGACESSLWLRRL